MSSNDQILQSKNFEDNDESEFEDATTDSSGKLAHYTRITSIDVNINLYFMFARTRRREPWFRHDSIESVRGDRTIFIVKTCTMLYKCQIIRHITS